MRIGQSRVIYSGVEEPLGVVYADDIYIYTYSQIQLLPRDYHTQSSSSFTTMTARTSSNMMQSKGQETDQCPTHVYSINIENVRWLLPLSLSLALFSMTIHSFIQIILLKLSKLGRLSHNCNKQVRAFFYLIEYIQ